MTRENCIALILEWLLGGCEVTVSEVAAELGVSRHAARRLLFKALKFSDGGWSYARGNRGAARYWFSASVQNRVLGGVG